MKASFVIFGVIFLVLGAVLYLVPMQEFEADTTTTDGENVATRTSYANITIPVIYTYASIVIGLILLIFGLMIPSSNKNSKKDSYNKVVESKENIELGKGNNRKIVRERTERHSSRGDRNDD
jgi:uncharacterized membrane protein